MTHMEHGLAPIEADYKAVWQPIETAPKDGSWVMCYWKTMPITQYPCVCFADGSFSNPKAFETVWSNEYGPEEVYPTHWMRLPPAPGTVVPDYKAERDLLARALADICEGAETYFYFKSDVELAQRILKEIEDEPR